MIRSFCNTDSFITAATSLISTVIVQWRTLGECPPPPPTRLFSTILLKLLTWLKGELCIVIWPTVPSGWLKTNLFFWSHSNLPSNSNNSTEFDDPTLIQNIEKNHVGVSEAEAYLKSEKNPTC